VPSILPHSGPGLHESLFHRLSSDAQKFEEWSHFQNQCQVRKHCNESFGNCRNDSIFDVFAGSFVILKAFQLLFVIFLVVVGGKLICARGHIWTLVNWELIHWGIASDVVISGSLHDEANVSFGFSIGGKFFG